MIIAIHTEICPLCDGKGTISITGYVFYGANDDANKIDESISAITCHGCNGKGWVKISEQIEGYIPTETYIPMLN